jgi:hypothetical protein
LDYVRECEREKRKRKKRKREREGEGQCEGGAGFKTTRVQLSVSSVAK